LSSAFGGGVLPLKSEISDPTRGGSENNRTYEGCATVSLGLALCLGLAHLLELRPFGEDFRPSFVRHDGGVKSSDQPSARLFRYYSLLLLPPLTLLPLCIMDPDINSQ